jgi:hypothetical protein
MSTQEVIYTKDEDLYTKDEDLYTYVKIMLNDFNNSQYERCLNVFEKICKKFPKEEIVLFMRKYREFYISHIIMKSLTSRLIMKPEVSGIRFSLINYLEFFEIMCKDNVEKVRLWLNQYKINFSDIMRIYPSFFKNIEYIIEKNDNEMRIMELEDKVEELEEQVKELEIQIKYQPNGDGYLEAKEHFESLLNE